MNKEQRLISISKQQMLVSRVDGSRPSFVSVRMNMLLSFVLVASLMQIPLPAQEQEVQSDRALDSLKNAYWYDAETGTYQKPKIAPEQDSEIRKSGWKANVKPRKQASSQSWRFPPALSESFSIIVTSLLGIGLLIVVGLVLYYTIRNYLPSPQRAPAKLGRIDVDTARAEALPFEVAQTNRNPLAEAEALIKLGKYDEALLFFYGYMLLALDQSRVIHLQKGKTNRMYIREIRSRSSLQALVEQIMLAFEDVYFGKHSISRENFESLWAELDRFHELLAAPLPGKPSSPPASTGGLATS